MAAPGACKPPEGGTPAAAPVPEEAELQQFLPHPQPLSRGRGEKRIDAERLRRVFPRGALERGGTCYRGGPIRESRRRLCQNGDPVTLLECTEAICVVQTRAISQGGTIHA